MPKEKIRKLKIDKPEVKGGFLENSQKPLFTLTHPELREILDHNWYPKANRALDEQRKIWDYSYLAYKGILLNHEINRKRRANSFGIYVNVPRTFMTIEGIRRNFNISKLKVQLDPAPGFEDQSKRRGLNSFLNYDLRRGGTFEQVKDAGFYKLLFGNGFLYPHLVDRQGKYGKITGNANLQTAVVKNTLDKKNTRKYFGMVAVAKSPYKIFPDPDGLTHDFNDVSNKACNYVCIRDVKHINTFRKDWRGIVPDKILDDVKPGGNDMTNYEDVREMVDEIFRYDMVRYPGTVQDIIGTIKSHKNFNNEEMVEERIWLGEDFLIVQAGLGLKFCLISPNPNPRKINNLVKLDDIKVPGEYWSMGEPYIMRYQQIEENRIHNSVLDTLHFAISGMMGINTQYLEDDQDLEIYPQKVWKMKAMPGVKVDEMIQQFTPSSSGIAAALKFKDEVKEIGQSTTSITDFVTGASKSIANTATEANKLSGASDLAIIDKVKEMAGGALTKVAKIFLSMYSDAYGGEELELIFENQKIFFTGKTKKDISEKELTKIIEKQGAKNILFLDDLNVAEPQFTIVGEVSLNRSQKFSEWIAAIDFSKGINETAFATGDSRRLDIIKMGKMALENFDVIGNVDEYEMADQPTKQDEIAMQAKLNNQGKNVANPGGAPKKNKVTQPQSSDSKIRQNAQPKNRGKNQISKKNL